MAHGENNYLAAPGAQREDLHGRAVHEIAQSREHGSLEGWSLN